MTLSFDIRVVWEGSKVGFVFAQRGIVPEAVSSYFLPKLIGHSKAMELLMTAKVNPATAPALSGLWSSVQPTPEATVDEAMRIARDIVKNNSMTSLAIVKALVWRAKDTPEEQHLLDSKAMYVSGRSIDCKEGVLSFKEKRAPSFKATIPKDLPTELMPWWSEADIALKTSKL
jgi:enoyl-CoA hydratase/carnithine racemase